MPAAQRACLELAHVCLQRPYKRALVSYEQVTGFEWKHLAGWPARRGAADPEAVRKPAYPAHNSGNRTLKWSKKDGHKKDVYFFCDSNQNQRVVADKRRKYDEPVCGLVDTLPDWATFSGLRAGARRRLGTFLVAGSNPQEVIGCLLGLAGGGNN